MIIGQTVEIPADYRIFLEIPRSIPSGIKAKVEIRIPDAITNGQSDSTVPLTDKIEEIRLLLQKEMSEKGTSTITAADGWEAHVMEHYAESFLHRLLP
jgi:hypothetical protein